MNDEEIVGLWTTLEPTMLQRRRMDARVSAWLDASDVSLAAEWLRLFRVEPFSAAGLVAASVVALATAPPFLWLTRSLL
jgi:hypothetical protein